MLCLHFSQRSDEHWVAWAVHPGVGVSQAMGTFVSKSSGPSGRSGGAASSTSGSSTSAWSARTGSSAASAAGPITKVTDLLLPSRTNLTPLTPSYPAVTDTNTASKREKKTRVFSWFFCSCKTREFELLWSHPPHNAAALRGSSVLQVFYWFLRSPGDQKISDGQFKKKTL